MSSFTLVNLLAGLMAIYLLHTASGWAKCIAGCIADSPLKVKWFYSVPAVAIVGIGVFFESPGFRRGALGIGFNCGEGRLAWFTLNYRTARLPNFSQDVNFGTAAFASKLEPVQSSMGIRCSVNTPYYVSLNNGLSRKMATNEP